MTLIYDIETHWKGNFNVQEDDFRTLSAYDVEQDTTYFYTYTDKESIQELFKKHEVIIGYNNINYDNPILTRFGIDLRYHIIIDLLQVVKKRGVYIGLENSGLSLAEVAKKLELEYHKMEDFDYTILLKDSWSDEERENIRLYNELDVTLTFTLYKKLVAYFEPFKEFLSPADVKNFSWLKSSVATYTYKVMCHQAGLKEEYDDEAVKKWYGGGHVAEPAKSEAHGHIYCLDFNSLYPHMYIMGNLASRSESGWSGGTFFPDLNGTYSTTKRGKIETVLHTLYLKRKAYKAQNNPLEYALKIVLNTFYGTTGNPVFKNLYNYDTAYDCTKMGQRCIKFSREIFEKAGYTFLYTDTDSVYLADPYNDEERLLMVKDRIITEIMRHVPFPVDTFDLGIDYRIRHIWFFKGEDSFKKKNYMFVTESGKLVIKGLPMIKRDGSGLGYHIFNKYMRAQVVHGQITFPYDTIRNAVYDELTQDISKAARIFKVRKHDSYANAEQIHAQISKQYGEGKHTLIPNRYVGVGKGIKYCTIQEFEASGLSIHAIILNKVWNELKPFLTYTPKEEKVGVKRNGQEELLRWTNIP